jgi:hypothetical protein
VLYSGDSSVDERRTGGKGARGDAFEKWLGGTGQRVKRGGVSVGASAWRWEKEERRGGWHGGRQRPLTVGLG